MVALVWKCYADMLCLLGKNSVWPYLRAGRSPKRRREFRLLAGRANSRRSFYPQPNFNTYTHAREWKIMEHPRLPYNDDDKVSYAPLYTPRRRGNGNEKFTFWGTYYYFVFYVYKQQQQQMHTPRLAVFFHVNTRFLRRWLHAFLRRTLRRARQIEMTARGDNYHRRVRYVTFHFMEISLRHQSASCS